MFIYKKKTGLNLDFIRKNIECSKISLKLHVVASTENYFHTEKLK